MSPRTLDREKVARKGMDYWSGRKADTAVTCVDRKRRSDGTTRSTEAANTHRKQHREHSSLLCPHFPLTLMELSARPDSDKTLGDENTHPPDVPCLPSESSSVM